jgi:hypothetical protein
MERGAPLIRSRPQPLHTAVPETLASYRKQLQLVCAILPGAELHTQLRGIPLQAHLRGLPADEYVSAIPARVHEELSGDELGAEGFRSLHHALERLQRSSLWMPIQEQ